MSSVDSHHELLHAPAPHPHPSPSHGPGLTILGVVVVTLACVLVLVLALHKNAATKREADARTRETALGPHVLVTKVVVSPAVHELTLPAEARGYFQTTAYAKVSGYVHSVLVDKGDRVKAGQVLGTIESPETDQAVRGARSDLALRLQLHARAKLLAPNVVSKQDLETATSNLLVSKSSMQSALALQSYETIRAPFDGIVTMRYVDPGALMPAATGSTSSAQPFVDIADAARLRIDAYVGQESAKLVHPGTPVTIWQDDPAKSVQASVTRTAGALDPRTRTMLCEIEIDNTRSGFLPGTFSHVTFHVASPPMPVIPAEALVLRGGDELAPVVKDAHVHFMRVTTGVSDGKTMQIVSGLQGGEMVALSLPAEIGDGDAVQAKEKPPEPAPGEASSGDAGRGARDGG